MATATLSSAEHSALSQLGFGRHQGPSVMIFSYKLALSSLEKGFSVNNARKSVMQSDPDYGETILGAFILVCDAFEQGRISWERRCELLEMLANDGAALLEVREYEKPHPDPEVKSIGVFLEPAAAFLNELGLLEPGTASLERAIRDTDVKR